MPTVNTISSPSLDCSALIDDLVERGSGLLSARIAAWMQAQGPVKAVAREVHVGADTLRAWREGRGVSGASLEKLADHYGAPFVEWVFAPWLQGAEADVLSRLARAEQELAAARQLLIEQQERDSRDADLARRAGTDAGSDIGGVRPVGAPVARAPRPAASAPSHRLARTPRTWAVALMLGAAVAGVTLALVGTNDDTPLRITRVGPRVRPPGSRWEGRGGPALRIVS